MADKIIMTEEMFDEAMDRAESMEDVLKIMEQLVGEEVTEKDLEAFVCTGEDGELTEDALDNVAGGYATRLMLRLSQTMLRHAQARLAQTMARLSYRTYSRYRRW